MPSDAEQPAREAVTRTAAWHIHKCNEPAGASGQRGTGKLASAGVLGPVYSDRVSGRGRACREGIACGFLLGSMMGRLVVN